MQHDDRGVTLVEAVLALILGTLVMALALMLLRQVSLSTARTDERAGVRETASLALATIRASLQDAWEVRAEAAGQRLEFRAPRGTGAVFRDDRRQLVIRRAGVTTPDVLVTGVRAFTALSHPGGLVRLSLEIERPRTGSPLAPLGPLTVVDDVFIPCVGLRSAAGPWQPTLEYQTAAERSGTEGR